MYLIIPMFHHLTFSKVIDVIQSTYLCLDEGYKQKNQKKKTTHFYNLLFYFINSCSINSSMSVILNFETKTKKNLEFFFSSRAFANGRFLMVTSNIMIFNPILVNIIQNSQTISVSFRLRPGKSGMRPWVTSSGNSF